MARKLIERRSHGFLERLMPLITSSGPGTKRVILAAAFILTTSNAAHADKDRKLVPPEVVQFENSFMDHDTRIVIVGNEKGSYQLYCEPKAASCIAPKEGMNYLLFDKNTYWKMPGATGFITLEFLQDWTIVYNNNETENFGLIPEKGAAAPNEIGMYVLKKGPHEGGYDQDIVISDGPIMYGTNLNDEGRQRAWQQFFMLMVESCARQQGKDVLGVKLAKRCDPAKESCFISIDANLVGVGGVQEPRKVAVYVGFDIHDQERQTFRMVCTWPDKKYKLCRDWMTGKLISWLDERP